MSSTASRASSSHEWRAARENPPTNAGGTTAAERNRRSTSRAAQPLASALGSSLSVLLQEAMTDVRGELDELKTWVDGRLLAVEANQVGEESRMQTMEGQIFEVQQLCSNSLSSLASQVRQRTGRQ